MRQVPQIAEMRIGHWLKIGVCGSRAPLRCHPGSLIRPGATGHVRRIKQKIYFAREACGDLFDRK
jgi:hypothetical protein